MTYVSPWSSWWGGVKLRDELKLAGSSLEGPIYFSCWRMLCVWDSWPWLPISQCRCGCWPDILTHPFSKKINVFTGYICRTISGYGLSGWWLWGPHKFVPPSLRVYLLSVIWYSTTKKLLRWWRVRWLHDWDKKLLLLPLRFKEHLFIYTETPACIQILCAILCFSVPFS